MNMSMRSSRSRRSRIAKNRCCAPRSSKARRGFDAQALHSVRRNYSHGTAVFNKVRAPQFDLSTRHGLHFCSNFDCVSARSEEHTSELQSLMRISYAVFCLKKKKNKIKKQHNKVEINYINQ